jgi:peptidoglycan LD-endopeptidase LytH
MRNRLAWKGWNLEFTARAWRLLVIAVLLGIGAAANSFSPSLPGTSLASTPASNLTASDVLPTLRDSVMALARERSARKGKAPSLSAYRRSAQVLLAIDELRQRSLLLPLPALTADQLHDSFTHLRGDGTRRHNAIDIPALRGTPILAVEDGMVIQMHESKAGGITLYASDPDQRFIYFYAHLDHYNSRMKEGLPLSRGDTIGYVGTTGNAAEGGPHLHFAILMSSNIARWSTGTPINPFEVFKP